jgi:tRNA pseudouridine55 synthase
MYSALKRDGVPLYRLARRGVTVEREARSVTIAALTLEHYAWPELELSVSCSKGTYVRTLVVDIAAALGTLGHVIVLRRTAVEPFAAEQMVSLDTLEALAASNDRAGLDALLLPADSALGDWPTVVLGADAAARLCHGQPVTADPAWRAGPVRIYRDTNDLLGIGEVTADGRLVSTRLFPP